MNWFGPSAGEQRDSGLNRALTIGLVNNTSDRASASTERQFLRLLHAASIGVELKFRFFTCPEIRRSTLPLSSMGCPYSKIDELYDTPLDALIVTGMEPQATALQDEPIWANLARLADWAEEQAVPVVWSCLAAHAAVLHLDGIVRSRLPEKLSGVFACDVVATGHKLMAGLPSRWATPHSRYYGVSGDALIANGYQVLSQSGEAAVNIFLKNAATTSIFIQGHPEYDADTLLREYKRDIRRYVVGERNEFPLAPKHCFATDSEAALNRLRQDALRGQCDPAILDAVSTLVKNEVPPNTWHGPAARFYANWLTCIATDDLRCSHTDRRPHRGTDQLHWMDPTAVGVPWNH
jgi:homoserine O-succinyltransferase/O-acetyltransferase